MNQLPAGLEEAGTMLPAKGTNEITHETEDTTQNAATPKNPTLCLSLSPA